MLARLSRYRFGELPMWEAPRPIRHPRHPGLDPDGGFLSSGPLHGDFFAAGPPAAHADPHWTNVAAQQALAFIAGFLPSLQRFTVTDWLVYHTGSVRDLLANGITTVIYLFLLTVVGLIDIHKKEF
ncbi:MAG: hypothetical protein H7833_11495 [Magnetococcus sp. DMHC-1]|nr:hypothetical protein [Magnetococcales bacterium]